MQRFNQLLNTRKMQVRALVEELNTTVSGPLSVFHERTLRRDRAVLRFFLEWPTLLICVQVLHTHTTHTGTPTTHTHTHKGHNRCFHSFFYFYLRFLSPLTAGLQSNHRHNTTECSHWIDSVLFAFSFAFFFLLLPICIIIF